MTVHLRGVPSEASVTTPAPAAPAPAPAASALAPAAVGPLSTQSNTVGIVPAKYTTELWTAAEAQDAKDCTEPSGGAAMLPQGLAPQSNTKASTPPAAQAAAPAAAPAAAEAVASAPAPAPAPSATEWLKTNNVATNADYKNKSTADLMNLKKQVTANYWKNLKQNYTKTTSGSYTPNNDGAYLATQRYQIQLQQINAEMESRG